MLTKFWLKWLVKKRMAGRTLPNLISFDKARNIMLLLNPDKDVKFGGFATPEYRQMFIGKQITMVVLNQHNKSIPYTSFEKNIRVINLFPKDFFWLGWPHKSYKSKMQEIKADLIMSFDKTYDVRLLLASTESENGFRVGLGESSMNSTYDLNLSIGEVSSYDEIFALQTSYLKSLTGENNA
jgi:hypothetical protein